jgi:hypothetical protein
MRVAFLRRKGDDRSPVHAVEIVVVVVGLGHLTHFKHIFHESHVPSQQT